MHMKVSRHAERRMRKRLGIGRDSCLRMAERIYEKGKKYSDTTGRLRRYIDFVRFKEGENKDFDVRVYGNYIYIYKEEVLITVYEIDKKLKRLACGDFNQS